MKNLIYLFLMFMLWVSAARSQSVIITTFDSDTEGWSVDGGNIYHHVQGGNPDGFIEFEDNQDGAGIFIAPAQFLGDLGEYNLGSIKFDLKNTNNNGQNMLYGFGNVKIFSQSITAEKNVVPFEYINDWTSFNIPLAAEDWGLTETGWDSLMSDVAGISIQMDAQWDYNDRVGLDNFSINPAYASSGPGFTVHETVLRSSLLYPNPVVHAAKLKLELNDREYITVSLFRSDGRFIKTVFSGEMSRGVHFLHIDCQDISTGVYFIKIQSAKEMVARKFVIN